MRKKRLFSVPASQKGVATLPTIFSFIILIVALAVGITTLSLSEIFISLGSYHSSRALIYAEAGVRDALVRIVRNKNYTCASADCYSIDFVPNGCAANEGCAKISVSSGVGSNGNPKVIISKGQVKNNIRKIQLDVVFDDSLNGKIATTTWKEITD